MNKADRVIAMAAIVLMLSASLMAQTPDTTELKNVRFQQTGEQAEFLIECTKPVSYESFTLLNPNRLVMDLTKIERISVNTQLAVGEAGVERIVIGQYRNDTARLVFHFSGGILQHRIEDTESGLKVVVTVPPPPPPVEKPEVIEVKRPGAKAQPKVRRYEPEAERKQPPSTSNHSVKDVSIGLGAGAFFMQDSAFKDVYDNYVISFRGDLALRLPFNVDSMDLWTSVSFFTADGTMTIFEDPTKLNMTTFSAALRYLRPAGKFVPFIGLGADYASYKETYPEDFIVPSVGGNHLGFHGQLGTYFHLGESLSIKVQLKYTMMKAMEDELEIDLGGIEYGLGLVWHFDL